MMLISKMKLTLLSVFALWTATLTTNAKEGKVTCTAPPVARGETGSITCHFPVDITTLRPVAYSVEHYASTESTEDSVLSCNWIDTEKPPCLPKDGYAFDGNVGRTLTLEIKSASIIHTGRYVCKAMSKDFQSNPDPCIFELTSDPNGTDCEPLDCGKGVSVCAKSKDDGPPKARCNCTGTGLTGTHCDVMPVGSIQENDKPWVVGVVAGIIVLIIVGGLLAVYCYCKRRGTSTDEKNMSGRSDAANLLNSGQPGDGDNVHNDTVPVTNDQETQKAELSAAQENQDSDNNDGNNTEPDTELLPQGKDDSLARKHVGEDGGTAEGATERAKTPCESAVVSEISRADGSDEKVIDPVAPDSHIKDERTGEQDIATGENRPCEESENPLVDGVDLSKGRSVGSICKQFDTKP